MSETSQYDNRETLRKLEEAFHGMFTGREDIPKRECNGTELFIRKLRERHNKTKESGVGL